MKFLLLFLLLKQQWGKETEKIRLLYNAKLEETKKINADLTKQTSEMSIKWKFLEEQDLELREKLSPKPISLQHTSTKIDDLYIIQTF